MIYIEFLGKTNKRERHLIGHVLNWVSIRLLPRYNLYITCHIIHNLLADGDVTYTDNDLKPREFYIRIKKNLSEIDLITLILHEFVHIKQFVKKELYSVHDSNYEYNTFFNGINITNMPYLDQLHEKEAYRLQEELYREYVLSTS